MIGGVRRLRDGDDGLGRIGDAISKNGVYLDGDTVASDGFLLLGGNRSRTDINDHCALKLQTNWNWQKP